MSRQMRTILQLGLVAVLLASLVLTGCGGGKPAAGGNEGNGSEAEATTAPEATAVPEVVPTAEPAAEEPTASEETGEETTEITNALDNVLQLAPVHITSAFENKRDEAVQNKGRVEADLDPKGNEHLIFYDQNDAKTELYLVDGTLYLGSEQGFIPVSQDVDKENAFSFVAIYGGAFLMGFNDLEDAKKVGSESVNGYQTDKYEIKYDLLGAGLGEAALATQGVEYEMKAYAWVETTTKAVVKGQVDWRSKAADTNVVETFHSEYNAEPGQVSEVKPPENLIQIPTGD